MEKKILIIGGLGFIGKNLYKHFQLQGDVTSTILTDAVHEENDGFLSEANRKDIIVGSILDSKFIEKSVEGYDVIFSLAGSSGAADSIKNPHKDLQLNLTGHLNILEACRKNNPKVLLIFPSSRLVYGKAITNSVDENHPLQPESIYAIHKITTESYYLLYQKLYGLNCIIFRVANPFGPYQKFGSNNYGILNWFIHKALMGEEIQIYGEGNQKRDFIHIDDLAKLFSLSIDRKNMYGKIFNVGSGQSISMRNSVETIARILPETKFSFKPWPDIDKQIETGDYISNIGLLKREVGWEPMVSFEDGVINTINFYKEK